MTGTHSRNDSRCAGQGDLSLPRLAPNLPAAAHHSPIQDTPSAPPPILPNALWRWMRWKNSALDFQADRDDKNARPSVRISPYQQFELVIVYRALPADHGTDGPHWPQRRVGVEAHRIARGPATPPAVAPDREIRLAGQGVDRRAIGRGVAGADHAQLLFHHVERGGTGEHQRPLARDAAGIG